MRAFLVIPALALCAIGGLTLTGADAPRSVIAGVEVTASVQVAALQHDDALSDACVWSAEAAAAGVASQCGQSKIVQIADTAEPAPRALVWPDDFIAITLEAAETAWRSTIDFMNDAYEYAFGSEKDDTSA